MIYSYFSVVQVDSLGRGVFAKMLGAGPLLPPVCSPASVFVIYEYIFSLSCHILQTFLSVNKYKRSPQADLFFYTLVVSTWCSWRGCVAAPKSLEIDLLCPIFNILCQSANIPRFPFRCSSLFVVIQPSLVAHHILSAS